METTVERVRAIASHLGGLPDSTIEIYIEDAKLEMNSMEFKASFKEKIMRYLTAHYATLDNPKIKSEKVDGLGAIAFSDSTSGKEGLKSTEYGQEVLRLLKKSNLSMLVTS
ncbi:conserved hypothetical protein [Alkaliphilus metalliredigens QYMF]|uniref:Uncharacterized protein n=1 Tax=Alkaliphilus metalliredigens (strain QYMF) TaxID=293826 RepID=A6TKD2_ALKMQ|nr:DUF4054 domain-containing protein [Alkaliphilus metalliredigens]ABR46650.1 conserved hypothetical protein [Alkaliphilus metalliredigens QYMF]ABR48122.1 conserved hypothetical protein [Alkaliphilus metalliredigens QYMF]ABR50433.1 conserved hypothetical protein [Alkaliphilus metalliredigens QYMF]